MKTLLTTSELIDYLGVSRPTLYAWVKDRGFPHIRIGRLNRYDQQEVDEWMAQQTLKANAEAAALQEAHPRLGRHDRHRPVTFVLD